MDRSGWDATSWVDQELAGSTFKDERLGRRLRKLLARMAGAVGAPIPLACQEWANTKAAYRFLSNEAVSEAEILAGHFRSTRSRVAAADGTILVLQDTTEFSYRRARPERIGAITTAPSRRGGDGRHRIAEERGEVAVRGLPRVEVAGEDGKAGQASVELRYRRVHVRPPIGKQKRYPALDLTVIHARERGEPEGRAAIDWKLVT